MVSERNTHQGCGGAASATQTAEPEQVSAGEANGPQIGEIAWHREVLDGHHPSDCPYCGCERVVVGEYEPCYDDAWDYRIEHKNPREAIERECFEMYAAFKTPENAVRCADMRAKEWVIPINEDTMRVLSDVCRSQSKRQLRAEAVERLQNHVEALKAEVEAQRKRANDAERGVLSEEWYVCRDRYEDDIAELTAERDELRGQLDTMRDVAREFRDERDQYEVLAVNAELWKDERDELQAAIDAMENGQFYAMHRRACEERDHLKKVVQTQAESFKKMEADLHALNSGETLNTLRASVAGLKDTVEKQKAEIERLKDENAELNMQVHGAPF